MTVNVLASKADFSLVCAPCPDREVCGVYIGDLLSWVMGKADSDDVWITIMSNINIVAVASLADVSCILLAEGVTLDEEVKLLAEQKGVNVLKTSLSAYDAAVLVSGTLC
jgi:predicted transcriptional regulator